MGVEFRGLDKLDKRLTAIQNGKAILGQLQTDVAAEAKRQTRPFSKSRNLSRSIEPGYLSGTEALVVARANYARFVEEGTGLYGPKKKKIVSKSGGPLVFPAKGKTTLGGRIRSQHIDKTTGKPKKGVLVFAMSVKGRKPTPFLIPGARIAAKKNGMKDLVIELWNGAA